MQLQMSVVRSGLLVIVAHVETRCWRGSKVVIESAVTVKV